MPNAHDVFINVVKRCFNLNNMKVTDDIQARRIVQDILEESDNPKNAEITAREYLSITPFSYEGHARLRQMMIYMSAYMDKHNVKKGETFKEIYKQLVEMVKPDGRSNAEEYYKTHNTAKDVIHGVEQDTIPEVIDWYAELEKRMSKDDPLFEKFKEFKLNVEEIRKQTFGIIPCKEKTPANYDWLHNLSEDTDGDIPNLKGLKDLFIAMIEYTSHYSDTGIKDYDRKMRKLYNIIGKALNIVNFE